MNKQSISLDKALIVDVYSHKAILKPFIAISEPVHICSIDCTLKDSQSLKTALRHAEFSAKSCNKKR